MRAKNGLQLQQKAYFSINPKCSAYLANLPPVPPGAEADSAIAGAAHATLSALYPAQKEFFDAQHAAAGLPRGVRLAQTVMPSVRRDSGWAVLGL